MKAAIYHPAYYLVWRVEGIIHLPHCQAWAKKTQAKQTTTPNLRCTHTPQLTSPASQTPQHSTALNMLENTVIATKLLVWFCRED